MLMRSRPLIAAASFSALLVPAVGAELGPAPAASTGAPDYSWSGSFFGTSAGIISARVPEFGAAWSSFAGGGQVGHNWQSGRFVFGAETDLQLSGGRDTFAAWQFSNPWFGSVRGRAGFALNNVLFYATAGLGYGDLRARVGNLADSRVLTGLTAGAGVEVGFARRWSARAEYLFLDLSERGYVFAGTRPSLESGYARVGVNYRF
jgi:outer membrane immunogenic protein